MILLKPTKKFYTFDSAHTTTASRTVDHSQYKFVTPENRETDELAQFCVVCIDKTYGNRKCSYDQALEFFEIAKFEIDFGYAEKLVDIVSGEMIGFYSLARWQQSMEDDEISIELGNLFVHPKYHRQGFGGVLFRRSIQNAKTRNCTKMQWISDPNAALFYEKKGARRYGYDKNVINPGAPVPLYEMSL